MRMLTGFRTVGTKEMAMRRRGSAQSDGVYEVYGGVNFRGQIPHECLRHSTEQRTVAVA